jgi:hypothetical protein
MKIIYNVLIKSFSTVNIASSSVVMPPHQWLYMCNINEKLERTQRAIITNEQKPLA